MALSPHATGPDPRRRQEILDRHARLRAEGAAQTLGVAPGTGGRALRSAFVALAKRFHPDSLEGADPERREKMQAVFIGIEEAYRALGGRHAAHAATRQAPSAPARPAPPAPSRLATRDPEALALLGGLYHREGLLARAEATLRRALASDPGHPEARTQLCAVTAARAQRRPFEPDRPRPRGLVSRLPSIAR